MQEHQLAFLQQANTMVQKFTQKLEARLAKEQEHSEF
jgi:hypothetical protein